jgi:hypothetical protein
MYEACTGIISRENCSRQSALIRPAAPHSIGNLRLKFFSSQRLTPLIGFFRRHRRFPFSFLSYNKTPATFVRCRNRRWQASSQATKFSPVLPARSLEPRILVHPDEVSKKTLKMMDKAIENLKNGKAGKKIDLESIPDVD